MTIGQVVELPQKALRKGIGQSKKTYHALRDFFWWNGREGRDNQRKLQALRGKFQGRRCFVMANGPSLLKCDLTLLKDEITIGSNAQYLIWERMGYAPTFLTVEDRLVAEDRAEELNAIKQTLKIFPRDLSYVLSYDEHTIFVNFVRQYDQFPRFSEDFAKRVFWGGTVSFMNLQLAYYLGCSPIYLIGFDHEYKVPKKIENFVITSQEDDPNHVHPDYFGKGYRWHDPNVARMEQSYWVARRFLEGRGVSVFNATVGGKLEVFERIDFGKVVGRG